MGGPQNTADTLEAILEHAYDGIVVVDKNGIITMFNRAYEEFLGVKREQVIGRPVTECIENTRMHIVVKTGIPEINWVQRMKGQDMVVQRIPIRKNGEIVGAVGKVVFKNAEELKALAEKLNLLEKKIELYEKELRRVTGAKYTFEDVIGQSEAILEAKSLALRVARGSSTVLIRGESGTGKELFAHAIHNASPRAHRPFIKINCAAIPKDLLESELFGYEAGAFTGASKGGKHGKFELADGGTIFLDEIGDMPLDMQAKVLRVLQEKEVQKIGGVEPKPVDVRVVAATNKNLEELMSRGRIREDFYYRLNIVTVSLPPLRERPEDVPLLVEHAASRLSRELDLPPKHFSKDALEVLQGHSWPGNVRELANIVERLMNTVEEEWITSYHLPIALKKRTLGKRPLHIGGGLRALLEETERQAILEALRVTGGNKLRASRLLGIGRTALYAKIKRLNIVL